MSQEQPNPSLRAAGPGSAMGLAERAFRKAIRQHEFSEPAGRILDVILTYSVGRGELKALVPKQRCFCVLCGLRPGKVSEELDRLKRSFVVSVETCEVRGRAWGLYGLNAPESWRVPLRVEDSRQLQDLDQWLEQLRVEQPELLPPPASLVDLLREDFVERARRVGLTGAVESSRVEGDGERPAVSSLAGNSGSRVPILEPEVEENLDPLQGVSAATSSPTGNCASSPTGNCASSPTGNCASSPTGNCGGGSTRAGAGARPSIDRLIDSRKKSESIDRSMGAEVYADVGDRLWRTIGRHERSGASAEMWARAIEVLPGELNELISHVREGQRLGRIKNVAGWLNRSVREALKMKEAV